MGPHVTGEQARERISALLDQVDAAHAEMAKMCSDTVGNAFRVHWAQRLETQHRMTGGLSYRVFGELDEPPDGPADPDLPEHLTVRELLHTRLRITPGEIRRRMRLAARIRPRRTLTGPTLAPELAHLGAAVQHGLIGEAHIREITHALDALPHWVSPAQRDRAEHTLLTHAATQDPAFLAVVGRRLGEVLNPDGVFDDTDRARRRALTLSTPSVNGMSRLAGWLDPETRAYLEAVQAAVRPGRHQPDQDTSVDPTGPDPRSPDPRSPDQRSPAQRLHDAVKLALKAAITTKTLGQHRGTPVTVIVRTTLTELNQACAATADPHIPMPPPARTGAGTALPMRDLIRMAADAIPYLAVFDDHTARPLYLARANRLASADQRLICHARDRGCTHPGCLQPGYHSEVHHAHPWALGGPTDADNLFFACTPHHKMIDTGQRTTQITPTGRLAWTNGTDPPQTNHAHHPEELLNDGPGAGEEDL